ncbi:sulfotransferase [Robiginitalea aurantiaca]|nr:sulfotransferase [Robiginitalea aurantiaca]
MVEMIYLLGAGRSGTTLLSAVLHAHKNIHTLGEMHQFPEYLGENKRCSCGRSLDKCEFWSLAIKDMSPDLLKTQDYKDELNKAEAHSRIPGYLLGQKSKKRYDKLQTEILRACSKATKKKWLLDSSKYISRFLLLNRNGELNIKGIYVVRDVRGVVESFGKNVQTPKGPLATLVYYGLINAFGEVVSRLFANVLKVRYEDFVRNPENVVEKILNHLNESDTAGDTLPAEFSMPHIIGGNRMKSERQIRINPEEQWRTRLPRWKQIAYYIGVWPLMIINGYKV